MRVLISSVGTRGDVQPALALAMALRDLGQQVRLCAPPNFVAWAGELGFEARPIGVEMRAPRPGETPQPIPDLIGDQFDVVQAASEGCDLIVGAGVHQYAVRSIAELTGAGCVVAAYAPTSLPSVDLDPQGSANAAAQELWTQQRQAWNGRSLERVNANRARLGLAPITDVIDHVLAGEAWLAADPVLGPPPTPETGLSIVQVGALVMPDHRPLPEAVERFLDAGPAPVYVGFGSMPAQGDIASTLIWAARTAGRRVILSRGWADLGLIDDGPDCIAIDDVSHQVLFPRLAAVVHHGGAGTTATAALAGTPQILSPMFGDQPYWARRVAERGVGLRVPHTGLTIDTLASAIDQATKPAVADAARSLAARVSPDGAATMARQLIDRFG